MCMYSRGTPEHVYLDMYTRMFKVVLFVTGKQKQKENKSRYLQRVY